MINLALNFLARDRLSVFLFHKVPAKMDPLLPQDLPLREFSDLLDFIAEHFDVIPLSDAVSALKQNKLPPRAACITFDDGYPDWMQHAIPMLEAKGLHATFFITTCQFDGVPMWHERISSAIRGSDNAEIGLQEYGVPLMPLGSIEQKRHAISTIERHLKYQTVECRDEAIADLERMTQANLNNVIQMDLNDVRKIHSKGFGIGAHTVRHPILSLCNAQEAMHEIGAVKEELEQIISGRVDSFAYPNGNPQMDFSPAHIAMVKAAGYSHAVTTQWGAARSGDSAFQIPRFTPWGPTPMRMQLQVLRNLTLRSSSLREA